MTEEQGDDLRREVRRCREAVSHILLLCAMPKKTEAGLKQVYDRLGTALLRCEPPAETVNITV